LGNYTERM